MKIDLDAFLLVGFIGYVWRLGVIIAYRFGARTAKPAIRNDGLMQ